MIRRAAAIALLPLPLALACAPAPRPATAGPATGIAGSGGGTGAAPASRGIFGEWALFTAPDSTAFAGARRVELSLHPGTFAITAYYPDAPTLVVSGALAGDSSGGVLVLTPTTVTRDGMPATNRLPLVPGQPITMIASTAGNSLLFIPPDRVTREPSSVWHRCEKAREAGEECR